MGLGNIPVGRATDNLHLLCWHHSSSDYFTSILLDGTEFKSSLKVANSSIHLLLSGLGFSRCYPCPELTLSLDKRDKSRLEIYAKPFMMPSLRK